MLTLLAARSVAELEADPHLQVRPRFETHTGRGGVEGGEAAFVSPTRSSQASGLWGPMARFFESIHGVYFDDLDPFEILHNARYLLLFERTIGRFWAHLGWGGVLDAQHNPDQFHLVRANHVEYLAAVRGVCQVRVRLTVAKLGRSSLVFRFRLMPLDEDRDHATGTRVIVRVDPETLRPTPWTEAFREHLAPYLEPGSPSA